MLENVIDTLENCRFCLMCRHVAPLTRVSDMETLTPHGIALVATSQKRGLIDWNSETVGVIYGEPDDGNARAHCVFDNPHHEAVAALRAQLVVADLAPAAAYAVRDALDKWQTPFAEQPPEAAQGTGATALFVGDEAAYLWPDLLDGVLKLLKATGVEPVLIGFGRNNALLATSLGFPDTAKMLAQKTLDELENSGATRLLVLSPGDYFTFTQAYDERLGLQLPDSVEVVEVIAYLAERLATGALQFVESAETNVAYVDPTHAVRHQERHAVVRRLVKAIYSAEAHELFWRRERAQPVGSTHLQFSNPELADKLTRARLQDAVESGANLLICEDPGTLAHLSRHADDFGVQVVGLYSLLAERLVQ